MLLVKAGRMIGDVQAGGQVLAREARILLEDLGMTPSLRQQPIKNSTDNRVPRTTGLPASTDGSTTMRGFSVMAYQTPDYCKTCSITT